MLLKSFIKSAKHLYEVVILRRQDHVRAAGRRSNPPMSENSTDMFEHIISAPVQNCKND